MQRLTLPQLCEDVLKAMAALKYSRSMLDSNRKVFSMLLIYASERRVDFLTQSLVEDFLREKFSFSNGMLVSEFPYLSSIAVRGMKRLQQFASSGHIQKRANVQEMHEWSMDDYGILCAYFSHQEKYGLAESSICRMKQRLQRFYQCLKAMGMTTILTVNKDVFNSFWISMQGDCARYCQDKLYCLGHYLRFLHRQGYLEHDLSDLLPKVQSPARKNLPSIWTNQDIEKLLSCIDRDNPVGKRDYAAYLIAAELGLRVSDINNLRLENLKWDSNTIEITQYKTGKLNVMPMTSAIGWALIDYLKHGRPESDEPYVFLTGKAPHTKLPSTALVVALKRYRKRCGLFIGRKAIVAGMHSLRQSLAHRLLEKDTPLDMIAEIMGHTHIDSTSPYLKIDIDGLRACTLSIEEVKQYASENI